MTTLGQTLANRENAAKSTGPTSTEGKAAAARNSFKHGLTALAVTLKSEDRAGYAAFEETYLAELEPQTVAQLELAERIVALVWKVRRAEAVETILWDSGGGTLEDMAVMFGTHAKELGLLMQYAGRNERKLSAARAEYRQLQAEHRRALVEAAKAEERKEKAEETQKKQREELAWAESIAVMHANYVGRSARVAAERAGKSIEDTKKEEEMAWQTAYGAELIKARKVVGWPVAELMSDEWYVEDAKKQAEKAKEKG